MNTAETYRRLTREEERALFIRYYDGDFEAREQIVQSLMPYVRAMAKKFAGCCRVPVDDLEQAGNVGLLLAVDRFNPAHGLRLSTFATHYIRREMIVAADGDSVVVPARDPLHPTKRRPPSPEIIEAAQRAKRRPFDIDLVLEHELPTEPPSEEVELAEELALLRRSIGRLSELRRLAIEDWLRGETFSEKSRRRGTTRENERAAFNKALADLRYLMGAEAA